MPNIERITTILEKLKPLNEEKMFLETRYSINKENYSKTFDSALQVKLQEDIKRLEELYSAINPLQIELRGLQTRYLVEYEGELTNVYNNNSKYWNKYNEEFFFKNSCEINTFENKINSISDVENLDKLLKEITDFLYYCRFTNFKILNIKKLQ